MRDEPHFDPHRSLEAQVTFEPVPTEPTSTLWQGELVPRQDLQDGGGERGLFNRPLDPDELQGDQPVVTIGTPQVLRALHHEETPGFEPVAARDFYLIRLWCSFHDFASDIRFDRASFTLSLSSASDPGATLVAHDMHPSEVLYEVKRDVGVALSPEVTFLETAAKIGSFSYGFSYTELQPAIVAAGQGESTPRWTFSSTKSRRLQGGKAMHLVVAAPQGTSRGDAELELIAHVTKPGTIPLPMALFAKQGAVPAQPLQVQLW